jgi:RHS repeat-associated protein
MIQTRYEFGDDLYSQVRWGDAILPPPGEGEGGGEGVTSFFLYDGLGSTRSLTDQDGNILQSYNYRPFGDFIEEPQTLSTNHLFTGEYYDSNLDYYYLRARYYSPGLGRFTGYDPIEDANNKLHRYAYCGNEPVSLIDLSGNMVGIGSLFVGIFILILLAALVAAVIVAAHLVLSALPSGRKYYEKVYDTIADPKSYLKRYCDDASSVFSVSSTMIGAIISAEAGENLYWGDQGFWDGVNANIEPATDLYRFKDGASSLGVCQITLREVTSLRAEI